MHLMLPQISSLIREARMRPFSNGMSYANWLANNCEKCRKYTAEEPYCPIENGLCIASITGEISDEMYKRMGKDSGVCTEREVKP